VGSLRTCRIMRTQSDACLRAHNVIAAVLKRLAHRNPNVQLYALSLAEALSKNCGIELHREIASRAFTQGLEKIITDRVRHLQPAMFHS
jgi:signal transducing adaptor molecule